VGRRPPMPPGMKARFRHAKHALSPRPERVSGAHLGIRRPQRNRANLTGEPDSRARERISRSAVVWPTPFSSRRPFFGLAYVTK
jgi:hypothetical protein